MRPPTGPDPSEVSGISTALSAGSTPPDICMMSRGCLRPASLSLSAARLKYAAEAGAT